MFWFLHFGLFYQDWLRNPLSHYITEKMQKRVKITKIAKKNKIDIASYNDHYFRCFVIYLYYFAIANIFVVNGTLEHTKHYFFLSILNKKCLAPAHDFFFLIFNNKNLLKIDFIDYSFTFCFQNFKWKSCLPRKFFWHYSGNNDQGAAI